MTERPTGLAPNACLWPDPVRGPWMLTAQFAVVDGRMEVVGLELRSARRGEWRDGEFVDAEPHLSDLLPPANDRIENVTGRQALPLKSDVWRSLKVGEVTDGLRAFYVDVLNELGWLASASKPVAARWTGRGDGGKVSLEEVAAIYLDALDAGEHPRMAVAAELFISDSAASNRIARARAAGYLGETTRGLPSRAPGAAPNVTAAASLRPSDPSDDTR